MMNLKDKIIAFDVDGTLARGDSYPSEYTCKEIKRLINEGYQISLVTGRNIISSIGVYNNCNMNMACVLCNGALVYDPISKTRYKDIVIPMEDIYAVLIDNQEIMPYIDDLLVEIEDKTYALTGKRWPNADIIGDFKEILPTNPNSIVISVINDEAQCKVGEIVAKSKNYRYRFWWLCGEFYNVHYTKREGVIDLLKIYNKTANDLIFFGDAENDREILEYAGIGIAMKNADETTKKFANQITEFTNNEDGAIKHLLKMIEENK